MTGVIEIVSQFTAAGVMLIGFALGGLRPLNSTFEYATFFILGAGFIVYGIFKND